MLLDPKTNDATRVSIKREDGLRKRVAKRSGEEID
jgi:ribosomal protein L24